MRSKERVQQQIERTTYTLSEGFKNRVAALYGASGLSTYLRSSSDAVLMYHSVGDVSLGLFGNVSKSRFKQDLERFTDEFSIVDLPHVIQENPNGVRRLAITFDDGFRNFYDEVFPLLREFQIPATLFISSNFIGRPDPTLVKSSHGVETNQRIFLNDEEIHELVDDELITIGNHTRTHPNLTNPSNERKRDEIIGAKKDLEERYDISIRRFCYPYGALDTDCVEIVRSSHEMAVGAEESLITAGVSAHKIPRIHAHKPKHRVAWELTELSDRMAFSRALAI